MKGVRKYLPWGMGILILLIAISIAFIRLVIIPEQTRISCDESARAAVSKITESTSRNEGIEERGEVYKYYYDSCFRRAGLRPESN